MAKSARQFQKTQRFAAFTMPLLLAAAVQAEDWPQFRGPNRDGVWHETGIRNPVRANFVELAEGWQWSSANARFQRADERRWLAIPDDPQLPRNWRSWVNKVETEAELNSLRRSVTRGLPFGDANWTRSSAVRLGLETTTRPRGRPKKET